MSKLRNSPADLVGFILVAALMPAVATGASSADVTFWPKLGKSVLARIERERADRAIPSISVGIVDRTGLVWSGGAGHADADGKVPVDANTSYRIGGLTQLLVAEAVRESAARGTLDLDAPVQKYLPAFQPRNPFGGDITLRNLLEHRSGLVREPPKGNHFETASITLAATVASLNATALATAPGAGYKYSDAGYAVLGRVLEVIAGKPLEHVLGTTVFEPMQMSRTTLQSPSASTLAYGVIAPLDAERFSPPIFDAGIAPSIGAYSSVGDLARLAQTLLNRDVSSLGGAASGEIAGHKAVSIQGSIYGYTSDLTLFPTDGLAVITLMAIHDAEPAARRIREFTARQVFPATKKQRAPVIAKSDKVPVGLAHRLEGHYSDGSRSLDIRIVDQQLYLEAPGLTGELRQRGGELAVDDVANYRDGIEFDARSRAVTLDGVTYQRTQWTRPAAPADELAGLVGEYGWVHNYIRIYERDGDVYARVEWSHHHKLEPVAKDAYRFNDGPYAHEELRFTRDERGIGAALSLSGFVLPRADFGAETEARSRTNARFVPELLAAARKMSPPTQPSGLRKPDLVEVHKLDASAKLDVRYATGENFMGAPFYEAPRFFLQKPAADALLRAHRKLAAQGFGIALIDGYRPWYVTRMFWDSVPPESRAFVADPAQGSRHNRGCAADITLFDLASGQLAVMPGRYDETSARSSPLYLGGTSVQRWRRDLLKQAMEAEGYDVYANEWWHFDYGEWRKYPVMNFEFGDIAH